MRNASGLRSFFFVGQVGIALAVDVPRQLLSGVNTGQGGGQIQRQGQQDQTRIHAPQGKEEGQHQGRNGCTEELFAVLAGLLIPVQTVDLLDVGQRQAAPSRRRKDRTFIIA